MPQATARDFLVASDNADDYAEALIEALEQPAREDIDRLYNDQQFRDEELWLELGVNPEIEIAEYEAVEPDERDLVWANGFAGLTAASALQFFLDEREETIIKPVAYREQVVGQLEVPPTVMVRAAKRGVEVTAEVATRLIDGPPVPGVPVTTAPTEQFVRLQKRFLDELSFLREIDDRELYRALREFNAIRPVDQLIADQSQYVARMTRYKPGSTQFKEAVNELIDTSSTKNIKYQNRRAVEGIYSYRETDGDFNTLMVWVGEGGQNTCEYCAAEFGEVKTYAEWLDYGQPGADICKGGDRCRCHLAAVGRLAA